jgi:predicted alpha/beta-fold hydrolase
MEEYLENRSYADQNLFSQCNTIWKKYEVNKARLPTAEETENESYRWSDDPRNRPTSFALFIGVHNLELSRKLLGISENFADKKTLPVAVLLHGAKGGLVNDYMIDHMI